MTPVFNPVWSRNDSHFFCFRGVKFIKPRRSWTPWVYCACDVRPPRLSPAGSHVRSYIHGENSGGREAAKKNKCQKHNNIIVFAWRSITITTAGREYLHRLLLCQPYLCSTSCVRHDAGHVMRLRLGRRLINLFLPLAQRTKTFHKWRRRQNMPYILYMGCWT